MDKRRKLNISANIAQPLREGIESLVQILIDDQQMRDLQEWGIDNGIDMDNDGNINLDSIDVPQLQEIYQDLEIMAYGQSGGYDGGMGNSDNESQTAEAYVIEAVEGSSARKGSMSSRRIRAARHQQPEHSAEVIVGFGNAPYSMNDFDKLSRGEQLQAIRGILKSDWTPEGNMFWNDYGLESNDDLAQKDGIKSNLYIRVIVDGKSDGADIDGWDEDDFENFMNDVFDNYVDELVYAFFGNANINVEAIDPISGNKIKVTTDMDKDESVDASANVGQSNIESWVRKNFAKKYRGNFTDDRLHDMTEDYLESIGKSFLEIGDDEYEDVYENIKEIITNKYMRKNAR
jgi:hypothetical protein